MIKHTNHLGFLCQRARHLVQNNRESFLLTEKSHIEYLEAHLFLKQDDGHVYASTLASIYNPLSSSEVPYYRPIEQAALSYLRTGDIDWAQLEKRSEEGFLKRFLRGMVPIELLAEREVLYAVTHDIFYSTIFGRDTRLFKDFLSSRRLLELMNLSFLISVRHRDIDVLMELMACVFILELADCLEPYVWDLSLAMVQAFSTEAGAIGKLKKDTPFESVYHTSLVAMIMSFLVDEQWHHPSERDEGKIPLPLLDDLLRNYGLMTSSYFLDDLSKQDGRALKKLDDLKSYHLLIGAVYLEQVLKEEKEASSSTLTLLRMLRHDVSELEAAYERLVNG